MSLRLVSGCRSLLLITFLTNIKGVSAEVFFGTWYFGLGLIGIVILFVWIFASGIHYYKENKRQVSTVSDPTSTGTHCHTQRGHPESSVCQYQDTQRRNPEAQRQFQPARPPPEYKSIFPNSTGPTDPQHTVATYPWPSANPTPYPPAANPTPYPPAANPTPYPPAANPPLYPPTTSVTYPTTNPPPYPSADPGTGNITGQPPGAALYQPPAYQEINY